jgi:hypothetical protein
MRHEQVRKLQAVGELGEQREDLRAHEHNARVNPHG